MQPKDNVWHSQSKPHSILVIGCGLIGASTAHALRRVLGEDCIIDGVEQNSAHRDVASESGVFNRVLRDLPEAKFLYDLAILAVPVDVAVALMQRVSSLSKIMMDVCSVKQPLIAQALSLGLQDTFAPTHPMAGIASEGPGRANPNLFENRSWLGIRGWPAIERVRELVTSLGAKWHTVASAEEHDRLMAVVSHSIHVTSLASMLAYHRRKEDLPVHGAQYCGPAFQDITRLSASPSGFWTSTLLSNKSFTVQQIRTVIDELRRFATALDEEDADSLRRLLDTAREARMQWELERDRDGNL